MRQSTAGFTLLEVMVAMAIVGFGVVTLLEIFSLGLRLGSRSNVHTEAVAYSARVMDELLARPKLRDGSESGTLASTESVARANTDAARCYALTQSWQQLGTQGNWRRDDGTRRRQRTTSRAQDAAARAQRQSMSRRSAAIVRPGSPSKVRVLVLPALPLIEVVLAIAIFALMGGVLYGAFSLGHTAVEKSEKNFSRSQQTRSIGDLLATYIRSGYPYRSRFKSNRFFSKASATV
jgi:prepilin-type N-terminal cleavage/methylation domain-containing protein